MAKEVKELQLMNMEMNVSCESEEYGVSVVSDRVHFMSTIMSNVSSRATMSLSSYTVKMATVLCIDIKGFTAGCAAMDARRVGEWVAEFYERVDIAAAAHGVSKVEVRGDCCICVAGLAGAVPSPPFADAAADAAHDQTTRMLNFAAALHADLASLTYRVDGEDGIARTTSTRMGVATGEVSFLISDDDGSGRFASVLGETMTMAGRMESLAEPGVVLLHSSAAERWAREQGGRAPPPTVCLEVKGRAPHRAAVFDCAAGDFRPATPAAAASICPFSPPPAVAMAGRRAGSAPP